MSYRSSLFTPFRQNPSLLPVCTCGGRQWSASDKKYLELFGNCWSCDQKAWNEGRMTLEQFEKRELQAAQESATV